VTGASTGHRLRAGAFAAPAMASTLLVAADESEIDRCRPMPFPRPSKVGGFRPSRPDLGDDRMGVDHVVHRHRGDGAV